MATNNGKKKSKKGSITGSELNSSARGTKAKTSKSKHFNKPQEEGVLNGNGINQTVETIANGARKVGEVARNTQKNFKTIRRTFSGGSELVTADTTQAFQKADDLGKEYGIEQTDIKSILRTSSYEVDETLPEMSAREANQKLLRISKQNRASDVRNERNKQKRKEISNNTEEIRLIGDLVDNRTAQIEVGTKVIHNQIAITDFNTAQSRLEEHEELLTQQTIRTQGVVNLTEGLKEEWELKFEQQERSNEQLRVAIEDASYRIDKSRREAEALMYTIDI